MQEVFQSFEELSPAGLILPAVALVAGLLLWAAGRKVLRFAIAAVGLVIGASIGWAIGEALGVPSWIPALILGAIAAIVAGVASKLAVAVGLAIVLGLGLPALTWTIADLTGNYQLPEITQTPEEATLEESPPDDGSLFDWINDGPGAFLPEIAAGTQPTDPAELVTPQEIKDAIEDTADSLGITKEDAEQQLEIAADFFRELTTAITDIWDQAPDDLQKLLILTAALGVLLGLVLGIFATKISTSIVTSFGGAALWMIAALIIAGGLGAPLAEHLPTSNVAWSAAWIVISVIGLAIQWTAFRKSADKPA